MADQGQRRFYLETGAPVAGAPASGATHSVTFKNRVASVFGGTLTAMSLTDVPAIGTSSSALTITPTSDVAEGLGFWTTFSSAPLAAQIIRGGRWRVRMDGVRASAFPTLVPALVAYLWDPVAGAVRGVLHDAVRRFDGSPGFPINEAGYHDFFFAGARVIVEAGDLLVVEPWVEAGTGFTAGAGISWDVGGGSDHEASFVEAPYPLAMLAASPTARDAVPVWTLLPEGAADLTEREVWLTDVEVAATGHELRQQLRAIPNRWIGITARGLRTADQSRLDALLAVGQQGYRFPWWLDGVPLTSLAAGAGAIPITTVDATARRFAAGGQALLWRSADLWEVVTVSAVTDTTLTLGAGEPVADWPVGTRCLPLLEVMLEAPSIDVTRHAATSGSADVEFRVVSIPDPEAP